MPNTTSIDWASTHPRKSGITKRFDLHVGDTVVFPDYTRDDGDLSKKGKINTGTVVGIYPYIIHIKYYIGRDKDIPMYRSYPKNAYLTGEVMKVL